MLQRVSIDRIDPSPFQFRRDDSPDAIRALADEIRVNGLWPGALRGRASNERIELCFGHRRLEAVKILGWKDVPVEVEDLTDFQMIEQAISENLLRKGLTDVEKLDSLNHLLAMYTKQKGMGRDDAIRQVAKVSGYQFNYLKQEVFAVETYSNEAQGAVRSGEISVREATVANRIGGPPMIERAAVEGYERQHLEKILTALQKLPPGTIREKVKARLISGQVKDAEGVDKAYHDFAARETAKGEEPPDLMVILAFWTRTITGWSQALDKVLPFRDYIHSHPEGATEFCETVKPFVRKLNQLC